MSPFDFNDSGKTDGEDFPLPNGPFRGSSQNNNSNNHVGCGTIISIDNHNVSIGKMPILKPYRKRLGKYNFIGD